MAACLLASGMAQAQVANTVGNFAGDATGGWSGGANPPVTGPSDGSCANIGNVGSQNATSDYGFSIPANATITDINFYVDAAAGNTDEQLRTQLASDASAVPVTTIGTFNDVTILGLGAPCSATEVHAFFFTLADWGTDSATVTPALVNSPNFGINFTTLESSSIKVDSNCLEIEYTTPSGPATQVGCFTVQFTVNKDFSDDNPTPVEITLACMNHDDITANPLMASDGNPAVFAVRDENGDATCTATETGGLPPNYAKDESDCQQGGLPADGGECTIVNTLQAPSMAVTKTVTNTGPFAAGDTINYTIEVTNDGEVALTNVVVSDPLLGLVNAVCSASLAPAASCQVMGSYLVTQADIDNNGGGDGDIDNTATANSDEAGPEQAIAEADLVAQNPVLTVTKTVTNTGPFGAGDTINYTIEVSNDGNTTLTNVVVSDPLLGLTNEPCSASLAPGDSCQVMGSYLVTQADIDNNGGGDGDIDNTAEADSDQVGPEQGSAAAPLVTQNPSMSVAKTVTNTGPFNAGDTINYTIEVTNDGNTTLTNVLVSDPLLGLTNEPCSASLAPGDSCQVMGSYLVTQGDIDDNGGGDGDIDNTATADSDQAGPEQASAEAELGGEPTMSVTKTVTNTGPFAAGDTINYTIEVTNDGGATLNNVVVSDPLLGLVNAVCSVSLAPAASCQVMGSYLVTQADIDNNGGGDGDIDNTATADSDEAGPEQASAEAPLVAQDASLAVTKTVTNTGSGPGGTFDVGDTINYTIEVTNDGNTTLTNVVVSDPLLGLTNEPCSASLAPGDSCQVMGSYLVTQADIDNNGGGDGDIDNTATADSDQAGPQQASAAAPLVPLDPDVTLEKSADPTTYSMAGDVITYTFLVTNTGSVTLFNISVSDPLITDPPNNGTITCPSGNPIPSLAIGASESCTGTYTITEDDVLNGEVTNLGMVTADCSEPGRGKSCASDDDSEVVGGEGLRTTFRVQKDFSDDNPAGVTVLIECNTGLPLQQQGVVHDPDAAGLEPGDFTVIEFVVTDFVPGTMDCDIEEVIPAGYLPTYTAGATTGIADNIFSDDEACHYELIQSGQFTCDIFNELQPVDVVVEKIWIDDNPQFQQSTVVEVTLECDGPIIGGFQCLNGEGGNGNFCQEQFIDPSNPGEFLVLPHFEGTNCSATEEPIVGVLTDESDCEELIVFPGQGDSCVIVNTRLFAGIPTLNQYGLILLALLMLGVGAVAYRRFA